MDSPERQTYTLAEVAQRLGVNVKTIQRAIRDGDFPLPVIAIRSRRYVSRRILDRYLDGEEVA